ncbi:hypothetical protein WG906_06210 [Pedobacter sp. P351]|uniref:hypothetical protein n=1 Tax=Pedobacter superstes TaxID=3133441 RepID=UPI00309EF39B
MELKNNDLVKGASGRIGDQLVYRQRGGKTIIAKRPRPKIKPDTISQITTRELFYNAVLYAKTVIADEATKAIYQAKTQGNQTAYNLAVSDFCKAPEIRLCDSSDYTGLMGQVIRIRATDDFKVESVRLEIKDSSDAAIEEGEAVLGTNGVDWIYNTTAANPLLEGTKLIVSAADIPGNVTKKEFIL